MNMDTCRMCLRQTQLSSPKNPTESESSIVGDMSPRLLASMKSEEKHFNVIITPLTDENPELASYMTSRISVQVECSYSPSCEIG